ncbi:hypothetical protein HNP86_001347 [Methanococcus maripaludis]|uniref:Uncharacterized protein n=1 Tax=Methanococcus maripaludis TaxID=39152 RepID=A0A7J9NZP9_METMI|nr:hypothetical protein [Methanococcus maripaludis]MBA2851216.1 hypothetical protein [Methanococcus maripaludis]
MNLAFIFVIGLFVFVLRRMFLESFEALSYYVDSKADNVIYSIFCVILILWTICYIFSFKAIISIASTYFGVGIPTNTEFIMAGITVNLTGYLISRSIINSIVNFSFKLGLIEKADKKVNRSISIGYGGRTKKF